MCDLLQGTTFKVFERGSIILAANVVVWLRQKMEAKERCLCLVLFTFLVVSVFSTVSLFYLSAMVYIPTMNELEVR